MSSTHAAPEVDQEREHLEIHLEQWPNCLKLFQTLWAANGGQVSTKNIHRVVCPTADEGSIYKLVSDLRSHLAQWHESRGSRNRPLFQVQNARDGKGYRLVTATSKATGSSELDQRTQQSLNDRLFCRGVSRVDVLRRATFLKPLGDPLVIHDVILDGAIAGFVGVPAMQAVTTMTNTAPAFPSIVCEIKGRISEPVPNNPKVFLAGWTPPILDRGSILELVLGRTDYWTTLAAEHSIDRIHADILKGTLNPFTFPRRLDLPVVVLTADNRIAFCRRAGTDRVRYYPLCWEVSLGESIDADRDAGPGGVVDPAYAARAALEEELGIPDEVAREAKLTFVAIATEWRLLYANLVTVARLTTSTARHLKDWWPGRRDQEHTDLATPEFSLDSCLEIFFRGAYAGPDNPNATAPVFALARIALFSALCNEFGYANVIARI